MKTYSYLLAILFFFSFSTSKVSAQEGGAGKPALQLDLGVALGKRILSLNTAFFQTYGLGHTGKFRLGYGLRFNRLRSFDDLDYTTAPARVRKNKTGLESLWSTAIPSQLDTFVTENPGIGSFNLAFYTGYRVNPQLEAGLYASLIGLSFGPEQDGIYRSPAQEGVPLTVSGNPEKFNFLFASRGTYQLELFTRYWLSPRLGLKAGLDIYHSVYTTSREMNFGNRRFRNVSALFSASLSYRWGR